MIFFYKRKYQGTLEKIKELSETIDKKDKEIDKLQNDITNKRWEELCKLTTETNKNAKLVKDIEKLKDINKDISIENDDLTAKNNELRAENKELNKKIKSLERRIENLKKTRKLPSTKAPNQLIRVKLGASTKSNVRNHIKKEVI
jgi:chromosome segregation ATPase